MAIQIIRNISKCNFNEGNNSKQFIIIHDTGNSDVGADARAHAKLFNNPSAKVSYHIVVDAKEAIQTVEFNNRAWHAGVKYGPSSYSNANNSNSIGISMCVNTDGDKKKAYENLIDVTKQVMSKLGIKSENVIRHYDACAKNCPKWIMDNNLWNDFKSKIKSNSTSYTELTRILKLTTPNMKGNDVEYLQRKLSALGYKISVDGILGKETVDAIKEFQKLNKLTVDGIVGNNTWNKLI